MNKRKAFDVMREKKTRNLCDFSSKHRKEITTLPVGATKTINVLVGKKVPEKQMESKRAERNENEAHDTFGTTNLVHAAFCAESKLGEQTESFRRNA